MTSGSASGRIDDLVDVDSLLTPEDIELRQTVRRFGEQRLRPHVADWFESAEVPVRELASDLGKLGLLGMHLKGYGCGGSTATAYGLVCQELEAVDSGLRSLVSCRGHWQCSPSTGGAAKTSAIGGYPRWPPGT